jgi:hypothetical protein
MSFQILNLFRNNPNEWYVLLPAISLSKMIPRLLVQRITRINELKYITQ